jgi:hypothetical protein
MTILMFLFSLLILLWIISLFGKKTLVLKKFLLDSENTDGNIVTIVARKSGLFAWLLTHLFKISPETSLSATANDICFRYKSVTTEENALMTLKKGVAHIYCKYQKPFWLLVLSIVVLLAGIIGYIYFSQVHDKNRSYLSNCLKGKSFITAGQSKAATCGKRHPTTSA